MMVEKYALTQFDKTVIMKFNFLTMELTIGGYSKHRQFIESIIQQYWNLAEFPEMKFPQKNKVRYTTRCVIAKYRSVVQAMIADGAVIVEQIRAHGRML